MGLKGDSVPGVLVSKQALKTEEAPTVAFFTIPVPSVQTRR